MAGLALPSDVADLFETLKLINFYPDKLSRDDLYEITGQSLLTKSKRTCTLPWKFIYDISRYNYQARNVQAEDTLNMNMSRMGLRERHDRQLKQKQTTFHPLDILLTVFLCCEPTARQDIVMHLWGCKLAIPFIVQKSRTGMLSAYRWPLRCLVGQFDGEEMPLIEMPLKTISFIRIGENENLSKSFLLNCFIGGPEKAHPMFFHRDSEGSKKTRSSIVNGLIELGWFLPKGSSNDKFSSPRLFLNLRGDAKDLIKHLSVIGEMSTVTVILCTTHSLLTESENVIRHLLSNGSSVVVLLTDKTTNLDKIDKFFKMFPSSVYPVDVLDVISTEGLRLWDILKSLQYNVDKMEERNNRVISLQQSPLSICVEVDEKEMKYTEAYQYVNNIISRLSQVNIDDRKKCFLPLQETFWREWSKLDRDYYRFDQLETEEKKHYGNQKKIESKMKDVRTQQFKAIRPDNLSYPMEIFLVVLVHVPAETKRLFLRYLKLELDNLSRKHMAPFYKEYHALLLQQENANEQDRVKINEKLSKLDMKRIHISLGLEHFIREMGQIFEACESVSGKSVELNKRSKQAVLHDKLPEAACIALIEGYPLEILDGEACSVPMIWVKRILNILPNIINVSSKEDLRVHIISVLGIQSSGKSTFLNTLFGLQFAVSAGRCTRGAYMQLVRIGSDLKDSLKTDYILAIDTEGLKSAELTSNEYVKHDNELSTFVIGLADTTVINLMGENATYLQDNLPIAVHAFLRMNLVGLHPRCIIVHHNVDKRNKEKLLQQGHFLETVLNKYTKKACEIEKIPHKLFRDIIEFNISKHTDYFPALLEGERPMSPVSIGYSCESDLVRDKLVGFVQQSSDLSSLSKFSRHLENLWTAIKRDRFVYEFKTTLETEARINLDNGYFKILNKYVRDLEDINTDIIQSINAKKPLQYFKDKYLHDARVVERKHLKKLKIFFEKPKKVHTTRIKIWEKKYEKNFEDISEQNKTSDLENIATYFASITGRLIDNDQYKDFFSQYSKNKDLSLENEDAVFHKTWEDWIQSLPLGNKNVRSDSIAALHTVCPAHTYLLQESAVTQTSLKLFRPCIQKHINHPLKISSAKSLLSKMEDIRKTVESEYEKELMGVWHRQLPYSHRNPLAILLTIEKHLQHRLETEDKYNEINNMFRIDMLLCTARSCVYDLEKRNKETPQLLSLKQELREIAKHGEDVINDVTVILEDILNRVLVRSLNLQTNSIISKSLSKSKWKHIIKTKESILGHCLKYIVTSRDNKLLLQYVNYPVAAVTYYLQGILTEVIMSEVFIEECQVFVQLEIQKMLKLLKDFMASKDERYITPKELILDVISKTDLTTIDRTWISFKVENKMKFLKRYILVEHNFAGRLSSLSMQLECVKHFKSLIINNGTVTVKVNELCKSIIGCQEQCPFCKELCRYTKQHPDKHECYVHRPSGCAGRYWHQTKILSYETCPQHVDIGNLFWHNMSWVSFRDYNNVFPNWKLSTINTLEPSLIWKFIFVKKHSVLMDKFELPSNLPESWNSIEEHEALRAVDSQFRLETRV